MLLHSEVALFASFIQGSLVTTVSPVLVRDISADSMDPECIYRPPQFQEKLYM